MVAEQIRSQYLEQVIRGEMSVAEMEGKVLAVSRLVGGAAALAVHPDLDPQALAAAQAESASVVRNNSLKLILTAAKIGKRLYAESRRLRRLKRSLSPADIKRVLKEEGLDIVGDLYTFIDPEASIADMAWAVADLALGTDFNNRTAAVVKRFGRGKQATKHGVSTSKVATKDVTKRPSSFRKKTVQDAWDNAAEGSRPGTKACPTCGKDVEVAPGQGRRDWDVDHQPKWKDRDLRGMDRKQVLDEYNKNVRLRCPGCNRSDN